MKNPVTQGTDFLLVSWSCRDKTAAPLQALQIRDAGGAGPNRARDKSARTR